MKKMPAIQLGLCGMLLILGALACATSRQVSEITMTTGKGHDLTVSGRVQCRRGFSPVLSSGLGVSAATSWMEIQWCHSPLKIFNFGELSQGQAHCPMPFYVRFTSREVKGAHVHLQLFDTDGHLLTEAGHDEPLGAEKEMVQAGSASYLAPWNRERCFMMGLKEIENASRYTLTVDRF